MTTQQWKQALYRNKIDWKLNGKPSPVVEDADGKHVATFATPELAARAVRAVNAHDALVTALQDCATGLDEIAAYLRRTGDNPELALARANQARAVLKLVKKE